MIDWTEVEHLPTRKLMARFDGTNGSEIEALVADPDLCQWDGWQLIVVNEQGEFKVATGDPVLAEADGSAFYPMPQRRFDVQYRVLGNGAEPTDDQDIRNYYVDLVAELRAEVRQLRADLDRAEGRS